MERLMQYHQAKQANPSQSHSPLPTTRTKKSKTRKKSINATTVNTRKKSVNIINVTTVNRVCDLSANNFIGTVSFLTYIIKYYNIL